MKGKLTEAGRALVAKMGRAYEDCSAYNVNPKGMEAALRVAAEEMLKMPTKEEDFDRAGFVDGRRNALFAPLSPEDRVTIQPSAMSNPSVYIDGQCVLIFAEPKDAEAFRLGLIQQIKEGKR